MYKTFDQIEDDVIAILANGHKSDYIKSQIIDLLAGIRQLINDLNSGLHN